MKNNIQLSLFISLLAFLSFQMTCNDLPTTGPEVVAKKCIDETKINPKKGCPRNFDPVCGCDNKTYSNECEAEKKGVTSWTKGECPCIVKTLIDPDMPCTKEFKPVCGCDNKTYDNECMAQKAGVTKWTKGKCKPTSSTDCIDKSKISLRPCPDNYSPVCGCDNVTYANQCQAEIRGVTSWTKGACCIDPTKISKKPCPRIYKPVCGCDGVTYSNNCEAKNNGIISYTQGKCEDAKNCIDESKIDPSKGCVKIFQPVCGCDGKTYGNECEAEKAGVTKWEPGRCNTNN